MNSGGRGRQREGERKERARECYYVVHLYLCVTSLSIKFWQIKYRLLDPFLGFRVSKIAHIDLLTEQELSGS